MTTLVNKVTFFFEFDLSLSNLSLAYLSLAFLSLAYLSLAYLSLAATQVRALTADGVDDIAACLP